jgi:hypothetical protein
VGVAGDALSAIEARDWDRLKPLLHPYVRWGAGEGRPRSGRTNVLAFLADAPTPRAPGTVELRDSQIYHWNERVAG